MILKLISSILINLTAPGLGMCPAVHLVRFVRT